MNCPMKTAFTLLATAACAFLFTTAATADQVQDATATAKIETAFLFNEHLNPYEISTSTQDGAVTLTGNVDSQIQKDLAERIAKSVNGVKQVINNITIGSADTAQVIQDQTRQNQQQQSQEQQNQAQQNQAQQNQAQQDQQQRAREQLTRERQDENRQTRNQQVQNQQNQAQPRARSESHNWADSANDATVTASVATRLQFQQGLDASRIQIDSQNGKVTLQGTVPSERDRQQAIEIVSSTRGVRDVTDNLRVQGGMGRQPAGIARRDEMPDTVDYEETQEARRSQQDWEQPDLDRSDMQTELSPRYRPGDVDTWEEVGREQQAWADDLQQDLQKQRSEGVARPQGEPQADDAPRMARRPDDRPRQEASRDRDQAREYRREPQPRRGQEDMQRSRSEYQQSRREAEDLREQADAIRNEARDDIRDQRQMLQEQRDGLSDEQAEQLEDSVETRIRQIRRTADARADRLEDQADRIEDQSQDRWEQARGRVEQWTERAGDRFDTARQDVRRGTREFRSEAGERMENAQETASDEWIEKRIELDLMLSRNVSVWDLDVEVENGVARLAGRVDNQNQRDVAERIARQTEGVREIQNNIRVQPEEQR